MDRRGHVRRPHLLAVPTGGSPGAGPVDIDQYGRGDYDPDTGLYEWYDIPPEQLRQFDSPGDSLTWPVLFERWALIEADLHEVYGIDLDDEHLMATRTWRWLRTRIAGLISTNTRIARSMAPTRR